MDWLWSKTTICWEAKRSSILVDDEGCRIRRDKGWSWRRCGGRCLSSFRCRSGTGYLRWSLTGPPCSGGTATRCQLQAQYTNKRYCGKAKKTAGLCVYMSFEQGMAQREISPGYDDVVSSFFCTATAKRYLKYPEHWLPPSLLVRTA